MTPLPRAATEAAVPKAGLKKCDDLGDKKLCKKEKKACTGAKEKPEKCSKLCRKKKQKKNCRKTCCRPPPSPSPSPPPRAEPFAAAALAAEGLYRPYRQGQ